MGERKGTNKYYPPDFDPQKHKSLAGYTGQHPLRERAKKIKQGILVIRFEMPYNIWCDGCKNHIGMGVRYNAEKSKVGMYYTTPIWQFRMKCHLCDNYMVIKTDPAAHDYIIVEGARRKEQRWDPKENEQIVPEDKATQKKLFQDAMYRLEHGSEDAAKMRSSAPSINKLTQLQAQRRDHYELNKMMRQQFREEKQSLKQLAESDAALLRKSSLDIPLLAENDGDKRLAELLQYSTVKSYDERQSEKRKEIESRPLFSTKMPGSGNTSPLDSRQSKVKSIQMKLGALKKTGSFTASSPINSHMDLGIIRKPRKSEGVVSNSPAVSCSDSGTERLPEGGQRNQEPVTEERSKDSGDSAHTSTEVSASAMQCMVPGDSLTRAVDSSCSDSQRNQRVPVQATGTISLVSNYDSSSNSGSES